MTTASALNPKQQRFADGYLAHGNAARAYRDAGYAATGNASEAAASRLLRDVKVSAYIASHRDAAAEKAGVTVEWIAEKLRTVVELGLCERKTRVTIKGGDGLVDDEIYKANLAAANVALTKLGEWRGMFKGEGDDTERGVRIHVSDRPATPDEWARKYGRFGTS